MLFSLLGQLLEQFLLVGSRLTALRNRSGFLDQVVDLALQVFQLSAALLVVATEAVKFAGFQLQIELNAAGDFGFQIQVGAQSFILVGQLDDAALKLGLDPQQRLGLLAGFPGERGVLLTQLGREFLDALKAGDLSAQLRLALLA